MGTLPTDVAAEAVAVFQALDRAMSASMKRIQDASSELNTSWTGSAHDHFEQAAKYWRLAYVGLFGDSYTQRPGVIGEIAHRMGVPWYEDAVPVTDVGASTSGLTTSALTRRAGRVVESPMARVAGRVVQAPLARRAGRVVESPVAKVAGRVVQAPMAHVQQPS